MTTASREGKAQPEMVALFVSDVHLQAAQPQTTNLFLSFLGRHAIHAKALYLLGDLFEYWAGDDDLSQPFHRRIAATLRSVRDTGVELFWIGGNRDFLVGDAFADAIGASRLPDPFVATIAGKPVVLTHGDALCTDDVYYMRFRAMVREPAWQQAFLAKPLAERKAIVEGLRERSETDKKMKSVEIMDVNATAVERLFDSAGTATLIHGHTHRPARHCLDNDTGKRWRYVLPDWEGDKSPMRGGWLGIDAQGEVHRFDVFGLPTGFDSAG